jgi:SAM-dependent methyltransferase
MKVRESGMPPEEAWARFFDVEGALAAFARTDCGPLAPAVEFGCGYGTFSVALAHRAHGDITALDIDPDMIDVTRRRAEDHRLSNLCVRECDFVSGGSGLPRESQQLALVFNLLHLDDPVNFLREVRKILKPSGRVWIMHWRTDVPTPRGPPLAIRPSLGDCRSWVAKAGYSNTCTVDLANSCPFHYGIVATA